VTTSATEQTGQDFKHRYHSRHGLPCAQPLVDERIRNRQFVRLIRLENKGSDPIEVLTFDPATDA
jgi:hypothetical protein